MKIYTSYFYQIRHFKRHMIPLSTAVWDPKWFHQHAMTVYKDKNGVYNGFRIEEFVPRNHECRGFDDCDAQVRGECNFLKQYRQQLDELDFDSVTEFFDQLCLTVNQWEHFEEEPVIVLIVYESPENPCSERRVIQEWFKDHGVIVEELDPRKEVSHAT